MLRQAVYKAEVEIT